MKILLWSLFFFPISLFSQPWLNDFTPVSWTFHEATSFNLDYDQGYILSLYVSKSSPVHEGHNLNYKVDDNGNVVYHFILGDGPNQNSFFEFPSLTSHGLLVLAGSTLEPAIGENPMLILLDSCRQKKWCTLLLNNDSEPDFFVEAHMLEDKSIIALSLQNDIDFFKPIFLHKFDSNGQPVWRKELASLTNHPLIWNPYVSKLLLLSDGGFLVTGECYWPNPDDPNGYKYLRMFIVKADSSGNEEWLYVHGINDYIYSSALSSVEYNGSIYTDGRRFNIDIGYPTPHFFKTSLYGEHLFDTTIVYPDYNNRRLKNVSILSKNVNGYFFPALKMYPFDALSEDARPAMAKIDTMGIVHDFFMFDTVPPLKYIGLPFPTKNNKIIVAGAKITNNPNYTDVFGSRLTTETLTLDSISWSSFTYDSLCPEIQSHTVPIENCMVVVNTSDFQPPVRHFGLQMSPIPTPANKDLKIVYDNTLLFRNITIKVFNILGNEVTSFSVNSGINESSINTEDWIDGMYVAVAYSGTEKIGHCKIIIKK